MWDVHHTFAWLFFAAGFKGGPSHVEEGGGHVAEAFGVWWVFGFSGRLSLGEGYKLV